MGRCDVRIGINTVHGIVLKRSEIELYKTGNLILKYCRKRNNLLTSLQYLQYDPDALSTWFSYRTVDLESHSKWCTYIGFQDHCRQFNQTRVCKPGPFYNLLKAGLFNIFTICFTNQIVFLISKAVFYINLYTYFWFWGKEGRRDAAKCTWLRRCRSSKLFPSKPRYLFCCLWTFNTFK